MARRFLSYDEAAAIFGVSRRLISDLVTRGELPVVELGKRRLIPAVVVDALEARALDGFDVDAALAALDRKAS
jgi:excisionase family DNA binding protein